MKISHQWIKELLPHSLSPQEVAQILTEIGLEVENIHEYVSHKGLEQVVVGEVIDKQKHPNADKLWLTKVHIGNDKTLHIVCGAQNVDVGQKVLVALEGAQLHTFSGQVIEIKKSKIRGEISEGMICAADELGISSDHSGIMILPQEIPAGLPATEYFKVSTDAIFEIGLSANRGDAASHIGIARDLKAYLKTHYPDKYDHIHLHFPASIDFPDPSGTIDIDIQIKNTEDCKRYAGIVINGIKVAPSPQWLQNKLNAVGIRPINNIVDITNFVMIELGQPLHAFDVSAIKGNKIIVQNVKEGTRFVTLDGIERTLSSSDLMICNAEEPMCIAGIYGGLHSGVHNHTQAIFLESAWFNPSCIRRTAHRLGLKTDAAFRFERFADPDMVIYALNRALSLILEIAGGSLSMSVKDVYPYPIQPHKVGYSIRQANDLFGQEISFEVTKKIIQELEIEIESESHEGMLLIVPPRKSDITREVDVAEEVLRIYGYNNILPQKHIKYHLSHIQTNTHYPIDQSQWTYFIREISKLLVDKGFYEMQGLSFHNKNYYKDTTSLVKIKNPINSELDVLRQNLMFNALQNIALNERHQQKNILGFEIGKIYSHIPPSFVEEYRLSLFSAGKNILPESFYHSNKAFYFIKEIIESIFHLSASTYVIKDAQNDYFQKGLSYYTLQDEWLAHIGFINTPTLQSFDISTLPVIYAEVSLEKIYQYYLQRNITYQELNKFPIVERDLSLLLDKNIRYADIKRIILEADNLHIKKVEIFDYYEGQNIPTDKKSYAVRLYLQNDSKTLSDKDIDAIMKKVIQTLQKQLKAQLR